MEPLNNDINNATVETAEQSQPKARRRSRAPRSSNTPSLVRTDFIKYVSKEFAYKLDWIHPITKERFPHASIKEKIGEYKYMNPRNHKALFAFMTTGGTRSLLAERFQYSGSTLRRRCDQAVDVILLMLFFPDICGEAFRLYDYVD